MNRKLSIVCLVMLVLLVGCGKKETVVNNNGDSKINAKKILVAYFTLPETDGVDASSSASRVILDNKVIGSTEYMAKMIHENVSADLFGISTVESYPGIHDPLVDQASKENEDKARPALKEEVRTFSDYDTVFIGYPNWCGDMPMPLYSF